MKLKEFDGGLEASEPVKIVLGIDQSYSGFALTALALYDEPKYHTWVYKAEGTGVERLKSIGNFLEDATLGLMVGGYEIVDAAMEGYAYSAQMGHMAGELGAVVKLTLHRVCRTTAAQYPLIVTPSMLKKYVTGKGNGVQKNQMLLQTYKTWGVEFNDDNACDSFGLAMIASGRSQQAYQKEVLGKLQDPKFRERP